MTTKPLESHSNQVKDLIEAEKVQFISQANQMGGRVSVGDLWSSLLESPRQHLLKVLLSISFNCLPWSILMLEKKESLILLERGLQGVPRAIPAYFDLVFQRARIEVQL